MNPGDRVTTNNGPGTLKRYVIDRAWAYNRPNVITWAAVKLDSSDQVILFLPSQIKEAPVPMNEPEPTPTQPDPDPQPEPEPEPEPDTDDEDSKATRRTITIEDEELVGQANLIEWP